jgi:hypothetical protein
VKQASLAILAVSLPACNRDTPGKSTRFRLIAVQDVALKDKAKPVARAS